jgi:glucoamylase
MIEMENHEGHEEHEEKTIGGGWFFFTLFVFFVPFVVLYSVCAQTSLAPGSPGQPSLPLKAPREAFATTASFDSKVWLALRGGLIGEVAWPRVNALNIHSLILAVTDGKSFAVAEDDPTMVRQLVITNPRALSFRQINFHPLRRFTLSKSFTIDPETSAALIEVEFNGQPGQQLYVICDPMMAGTDADDTASAYGGQGAFVMYEKYYSAALIADVGFDEMSVGFEGASDGWNDLKKNFRLTRKYTKAENGNVVCVARIRRPAEQQGKPLRFTLALAFSDEPETALLDAEHALETGFAALQREYEKGWNEWLSTITRPATKDEAQLNMAAMLLRAQEEKIGRSQVRHGKKK